MKALKILSRLGEKSKDLLGIKDKRKIPERRFIVQAVSIRKYQYIATD
jgi:hypothetical protein